MNRSEIGAYAQLDLASALLPNSARRPGRLKRCAKAGTPDGRPLRIGFILAPEFTLLAFSGFIETFRQLSDDGRRNNKTFCHWEILAADSRLLLASCGLRVEPTQTFDDPLAFDYIVIVGGQLPAQAPLVKRPARLRTLVPPPGVCR